MATSTHAQESSHAHPTTATYYTIFAVLIVLLVATVAAAEVDLGALNFPVAIGIATVKAVLIMMFFMHVRYSTPLVWLVAGAGFFWLSILFGITLADYFTRWYSPFST
jgi:cytochrome c oxidase subunit 4